MADVPDKGKIRRGASVNGVDFAACRLFREVLECGCLYRFCAFAS